MTIRDTRIRIIGIIAVLVIGTIIAYSGMGSNEFIHYDDAVYITNNPVVAKGLSWDAFVWAFTTTHASNWHPLTWLSHMFDVQLFGHDPAGYHFTNLFLHILATLLLFGFLSYTTRSVWPGAFVAALFAVHPLQVESVAWAAERKEVLSTVLGIAAIWVYAWYTRCPGIKRYVTVMALFALGLMAKPMLVTLPLLLLLLDYWPLERLVMNKRSILKLVTEKLPLLVMATASATITVIAQQSAIGGFDRIDLPIRIANAVMSQCVYLWQMILPTKLAVFYPYVLHPDPATVAGCSLLVAAITIAILRAGRRRKYLLTGWLWYIVTLVPVIGIVQVGSQAHADRYTRLPCIGIFMIVSWGLMVIVDRVGSGKKAVVIIASAAVLPAAGWLTWKQVGYWKNDYTLFSRAIAVTRDNATAYNNLGYFFERTGRIDEAVAHYQKAAMLDPGYAYAHYNLGLLYTDRGQTDTAIFHFQKALERNPDYAKARYNLGVLLTDRGRTDEALAHFLKVVEAIPNHAEAHNNLGSLLSDRGHTHEAQMHLQKALAIKPDYTDAHFNLRFLLADEGRMEEADIHFRAALHQRPGTIGNLQERALTLVQNGQFNEAKFVLERALILAKSAGDEARAGAIAHSLANIGKAIQAHD